MATRGSEEFEGVADVLQAGYGVIASGRTWIVVAGSIDAVPTWRGTVGPLSPPDVTLAVGDYRLRLQTGGEADIHIRQNGSPCEGSYEFEGRGEPPLLYD